MLHILNTGNMRSIKCRENISINTIKHYILRLAEHSAFGPVLGNILIIVLPALSYSCDAPELSRDETGSITTLRTLDNKGNTIKEGAHADILVFNDDRMRRLDSYQRVNLSECSVINAFSTTGHKIMTVILNIRNDPYGWADINSYEAFIELTKDEEKGELCEQKMTHVKSLLRMVKAIETLLNDSELRKQMGEKGRCRYKEKYTLEAFEKKLREILSGILN